MKRLSPRLLPLVSATLIVLATLVVYLPAVPGGLLMDDDGHITSPELRSLEGLRSIWFKIGATAHYYPLLNTIFWIEYHLWGDDPFYYHIANILQHAASAILVSAIMRRLSLPGALLGGLFFALHPVHVDSVAWISEQKNTLSTLFGLAAVTVYLRFDQTRTSGSYLTATSLFVASLLCKTVSAVLAPTLLVVFWRSRGRVGFRRDIVPLAPWFILGASLGLLSAWFEQSFGHASGVYFQLSWIERGLLASRAIWFYAQTILWPGNLSFIPVRWFLAPDQPSLLIAALAIVGTLAALVWYAHRDRTPLAVFLLFSGMLFPVLGFLNINWFLFSYVADHFQYLPSLALTVCAAGLMGHLSWRTPGWQSKSARIGSILICGALGVLTFLRSGVYASAELLYRDTIQRNPSAWIAHHNLGVILIDKPGGLEEGLSHLEQTLELFPDHARAHSNYAIALGRLGRMEEALQHFQRSLQLQYNVPEVHYNFGLALRSSGHTAEAQREFEEALLLSPRYLNAQLAIGESLAATPNREEEAIAAYEKALQMVPGRAETHNDLGTVLVRLPGRRNDGLAHYREAIRLKPEEPTSYINLGVALAEEESQLPESLTVLRTALRLDPKSVDGHFNLGLLLVRQESTQAEALDHLRTAARNRSDDPELLTAVGRVLLQVPQCHSEAANLFRAVVRLQPNSPEALANYRIALSLVSSAQAQR